MRPSNWVTRAKALYNKKFFLDVFLAFSLCYLAGEAYVRVSPWRLAFNSTASIERGLYAVRELHANEVPVRGGFYCFAYKAPAELALREYFPAGSTLCKPLVGIPGDLIGQDGEMLYRVDPSGAKTVLARVPEVDSKGRDLPTPFKGQSRVLQPDEYLLIAGAKPNSLDSRFLGAFSRAELVKTARPLLTFN